MPRTPDVVVVGGGIVGCAIAYRLALEKASVVLVEKGDVGREASWAAGGILTPVHLAEYPTPLASLCAASLKLYEPLVREVRQLSGIDPEFRVSGLLLLVRGDAGEEAARTLEAWKQERGQPAERLSRDAALARQPGLADAVRGALYLPDIAQVRNHRMTAALAQAAARLGAEIRPQTPVTGFLRVPGRVNGVKTSRGDVYAGTTVLAAGAWSPECVRGLGLELLVRPVKGQMVLTGAAPDLVRHVLLDGETYLVPRADGKILVGSTLEDAGFDKTVTLEGVSDLARRAAAFFPGVRELPLLGSWAGLRPSTPDRLPYLGRAPLEGLVVATGHFRNGILLAPITAEVVTELVAGRAPSVSLEPFDPARTPA
jgi:glycine oxidase